ncbi:MAG: ATP-binding protein [Oscillospiraceae bacterium]|nr:ATP-binding protein [Oscillospiraceae bacterium]
MSQTAFQRALQEVSARRIRAQMEQEERCQEIEKKIPGIAEINRQLSQSLLRIMRGEDIDVIQKQNLEAQRLCAQKLETYKYPGNYLDIHYTCPACCDTGYVNDGQYCQCVKKLASIYAVADMHETAQIQLCRFEDFSLAYYQEPETCKYYAYMSNVLKFCQDYAANFSQDSQSMLFWGKAGTGKTHLSLSIVTEVLKKGYDVIYDSTGNLLSKVESEHFRSHDTPETDTLQLLLDTDLLVLDDLGTEFQSSFSLSTIYTIINTRINKHLPTIISTNLEADEITAIYQTRITSRLFTVYKTIQFVNVDIRKKKAEKNQFSMHFE